jgi:hypothetical protein
MHHLTHRSLQMQTHKFDVMSPGALFIETVASPPEHEKSCIEVSCHGRTRMHYVTDISHWIQKHKFGVTCPATHFTETTLGPPEHEK